MEVRQGKTGAYCVWNSAGELLLEGAIADAGRPLGPDETLVDYDGIILRVRGDGHQYSVVLTSG